MVPLNVSQHEGKLQNCEVTYQPKSSAFYYLIFFLYNILQKFFLIIAISNYDMS